MAEKVYKGEILNVLMREMGMSEDVAADVLHKFFTLIIEALEKERYVKVNGLGIFKLVDVEPRRSVDVNTGQPIEISGHRKVSFVADSVLKEKINSPFSHFQVVALREGVHFDLNSDEKEIAVVGQSDNVVEDFSLPLSEESEKVEEGNNVELAPSAIEESLSNDGGLELENRGDADNIGEGNDVESEAEKIKSDAESVKKSTEEQTCQSRIKKGDEGDNLGYVAIENKQEEVVAKHKLINRREELRNLEDMLESEEKRSRLALNFIVLLIVLLVMMGFLFLFTPEFLENLLF